MQAGIQLIQNGSFSTKQSFRYRSEGRVTGTRGPLVLARLPYASIGDSCRIGMSGLTAQVVGFDGEIVSLAPLDGTAGVHMGAKVENTGLPFSFDLGFEPLGQILNARGELIRSIAERRENRSPVRLFADMPSPMPLDRLSISHPLDTGIKSIDALLTIGRGQRIGVFAEAGVGKSTLLAMIARNAEADVRVIALVGERGREVNAFIEESLDEDTRATTVMVVSTSDESAVRRALAPKIATSIAEYYRAQGRHVLLLVDSLTRTARAIREIGLAMGEIPVRHGYTPSVYSELPRLIERTGFSSRGAVTAVYSVLTGNDGESDPLGDELKSLLDGHFVMSDLLAGLGVRPAIDVTASRSRLLSELHPPQYIEKRDLICRLLGRLKRDKEILMLGGVPDKELSTALRMENKLYDFLSQSTSAKFSRKDSMEAVERLALEAGEIPGGSWPISVTA